MTPAYKTIILGLLEANRPLYQQLQASGELFRTMNRYAEALKAAHEDWKQTLPENAQSLAWELALKEFEAALGMTEPDEPTEMLDKVMAFIHGQR